MTRKLLHKTQKTYLIYSIITFFIVSPIFYFVTEKLYLDDADETLQLNKQRFDNQILPNFKINDIAIWNSYNPDNLILKTIPLQKDSIFSTIAFSEMEQEDEPYRVFYSAIQIENKPFLYSEKISLLESEDLLISIAILFVILIALLLIGIMMITSLMSKRIWQPFYRLINEIENFEIDKDVVPHFNTSNIEEFNRLNDSVEKLIRKNVEIYNSQREFIDNAAHELQTPLAIFRSKLDLLIQREDITKGQTEIIRAINRNINRLIKLNKNLLILSKIDRNKELDLEECSLKNILEKQVVFFTEQAKSKQINFTLKIDKDISVKANKNLTEILFSNLFLNAIQNNIENGNVQIEMIKNKVRISNSSDKPEISKDKLFNRFAKSNQNQQGNGLGLAIVKKIADQHHWEVAYSFVPSKHTFTIEF